MNSRQRRDTLWATASGIVFVAIVAAIWFALGHFRHTRVDGEFCPIAESMPTTLAFVIDQSDPFEKADLSWLRELVRTEVLTVKRYALVRVYRLNENEREPIEQVFSRCSPGNPVDGCGVTNNCALAEQEWSEKFGGPLEEAILASLSDKSSSRSPIFEALVVLARSVEFNRSGIEKRIVIVSDMLQHSSAFSHYRGPPDIASIKQSAEWIDLMRLRGTHVIVYLARRTSGSTGFVDQKKFWQQLFDEIGASVKFIG